MVLPPTKETVQMTVQLSPTTTNFSVYLYFRSIVFLRESPDQVGDVPANSDD